MMYSVVRRTNEIGVRIALGAPHAGVLWMVLRESLVLLGIGIALGVPAMLAACQAVRAGLFGAWAVGCDHAGGGGADHCCSDGGGCVLSGAAGDEGRSIVALRYE